MGTGQENKKVKKNVNLQRPAPSFLSFLLRSSSCQRTATGPPPRQSSLLLPLRVLVNFSSSSGVSFSRLFSTSLLRFSASSCLSPALCVSSGVPVLSLPIRSDRQKISTPPRQPHSKALGSASVLPADFRQYTSRSRPDPRASHGDSINSDRGIHFWYRVLLLCHSHAPTPLVTASRISHSSFALIEQGLL